MPTGRVYAAGSVLGGSLVAAVWLLTYRQWEVVYFEFPADRRPPYTERIETVVWTQPWWSAYASVAVIVVGLAASAWLLPEGRYLVGRLFRRLVSIPSRGRAAS